MALLVEGIGDGWIVVRRPRGKPELISFGSLDELRKAITRAMIKTAGVPYNTTAPRISAQQAPLPRNGAMRLPIVEQPPADLSIDEPIVIIEERLADVDCRSCGACCAPMDQREDIHAALEEEDIMRLPAFMRDALVTQIGGRSFIRTKKKDGVTTCAAFKGEIGGQCKCGIYSQRPVSCQLFEKGSDDCLAARAARGIRSDSEPAEKTRA